MATAAPSPTSTTRPPRHTATNSNASIGGSEAEELDMSVLSFGGGGGGGSSGGLDGSGSASGAKQQQRPRRRSSLGAPRLSEAEQAQAIKDYRLMVEYKWLKRQAPAGVYVLPSRELLRVWHGAVFVRRALFGTGIFKFRLELPPGYNDEGTRPSVAFVGPKPFHPLVHPETGELDLKGAYPEWDPDRHFVVTVLTFVKKIFYMKDADLEPILVGRAPALNPEAAKLLRTDRAEYERRVALCVAQSQEAVYDNNNGTTDTVTPSLRFTEPSPVHEALLAALRAAHARIEASERGSGGSKPQQAPTAEQQQAQQQAQAAAVLRRLPTLEIIRSLVEQQQQQQEGIDPAAAAPPQAKQQQQQQQQPSSSSPKPPPPPQAQQQQQAPPRSPGLLSGLFGRGAK